MKAPRTWESLRATPEPAKPAPIDGKLHDLFASQLGQEVMAWLWAQCVVSQLPIAADQRACLEHEGKRRLILDLNRRIEGVERERSGKQPANWHRPDSPSGG